MSRYIATEIIIHLAKRPLYYQVFYYTTDYSQEYKCLKKDDTHSGNIVICNNMDGSKSHYAK